MTRSSLSTDDLAGAQADADPHAAAPETPYPDEPASAATPQSPPTQDEAYAPLLDDAEAEDFLARWRDVQAQFVDDPQGAVRDGDGLVAELMQALAQRFSEQKGELEEHWNRGDEPETEALRHALREYRSFFHRLLST